MSKEEKKEESVAVELLLVCAEVAPAKDGHSMVRFGSQMNENVLIQMCKEDPNSWELVKKVIFDSLDRIETACGYKLNDDGTEVVRPEE